MLQCLNESCHIVLDVLATPWVENHIFGFLWVQHANRGQTKYSINTRPGLKPNNELGRGSELGQACMLKGSPRGQWAMRKRKRKLNHPPHPRKENTIGKRFLWRR